MIGREKLVMGLPFYGRAWFYDNPAKAYRHHATRDIIDKHKTEINYTDDGMPFIKYSTNIEVAHYYEDKNTIRNKLKHYSSKSIGQVAFWAICQEDPESWNLMGIKK